MGKAAADRPARELSRRIEGEWSHKISEDRRARKRARRNACSFEIEMSG
jgi:hypothetical protein